MYNKKRDGNRFDDATIQALWNKGQIVPGNDPNVFRKDACGHFIRRTGYGNIDDAYGWEIDHIKPLAKHGGDELSNLQPLFWKNNRAKGDDYPNWTCKYHS